MEPTILIRTDFSWVYVGTIPFINIEKKTPYYR